ncbi:unnamed protein product [Rotaria socialis]|uniref:BRCT domain-containing protein n=1 Tax=Rotaria socialis TaxID=392032 RepID=A0A817X6T9_9BILA|nr:unnamed protein product [Rotaria socialis]CAF3364316.1 unnamed protein product [Rotaria socialis]CAF3384948.1 unnamed protein product [Rotaria socialis]CAF3407842.1 unnamed protein product [Rotaria socialis]CAF3520831.1 unnamed protein product [Rotaria socialis]
MSYPIETNNITGQKYIVDVTRRRSICSVDGCMSQAQRNSLCTKHLRSYDRTKLANRTVNSKTCQNLRNQQCSMKKKRSSINQWSKSSTNQLSNDKSNINVNQIKEIFSEFQHCLGQNLNAETFPETKQLSLEIDADTISENSIEYDYTNPSSLLPTKHIEHRHVSIATIYLLDEQWHQLDLFIKHFSQYASLSNNLAVNSSTTHLVVDDSSHPLQCTLSKKIFQAVARRIFIVSIRWIEECLMRNKIIDETPFEIHGDATMSTMHLARQNSIVPLFSSSVSFAIDCASFQKALTRNELAELVILSGATLFNSEQLSTRDQSKTLLVLADAIADRHQLENKYKSCHMNVKFLTPGFLLKSIIYHQQQPFEDFEL